MAKPSQPHDAFYKRSLQEKKVMMDWCQAHLPEKIMKNMDLSTLSLVSNDFIDGSTKLHADIVYKCQLHHQDAYIYLVPEHQSTPEKMQAFRILEYVVKIMRGHLSQGNEK